MSVAQGEPIGCCSESSCDAMGKNPSSTPEETDDCSDICNPFQICKCCSVVNRNFNLVAYIPYLIFSNPQVDFKENIPPHYNLDFWQPPKLA